jgi:hypothetical protein
MAKTEDSLFDEIIETRIAPDGTLESGLKPDAEQEMEDAVADMGRAVNMKISKNKFCAGVQCLKRLYLLVHEPELAAELDAASEAVIEQGRDVGLLARQMFPGGVEIPSECGLD